MNTECRSLHAPDKIFLKTLAFVACSPCSNKKGGTEGGGAGVRRRKNLSTLSEFSHLTALPNLWSESLQVVYVIRFHASFRDSAPPCLSVCTFVGLTICLFKPICFVCCWYILNVYLYLCLHNPLAFKSFLFCLLLAWLVICFSDHLSIRFSKFIYILFCMTHLTFCSVSQAMLFFVAWWPSCLFEAFQ